MFLFGRIGSFFIARQSMQSILDGCSHLIANACHSSRRCPCCCILVTSCCPARDKPLSASDDGYELMACENVFFFVAPRVK